MAARRSLALLIMLLIMSSILTSSSHGRKLLIKDEEQQHDNKAPTLFHRLYLAALPKGRVSASAPSKKGHSFTIDEKLVARHLSAINRVLRSSVPSPGAGH